MISQAFAPLGLPSEVHFPRDRFEEWYATTALTHPRTKQRMEQGVLTWTKEEARARYEEELVILEEKYKEMYANHSRWNSIESFRVATLQQYLKKQPGPLPPYKTRVYELNDYISNYPEKDVVPPPMQRTLSHEEHAISVAMEKADECKEGDTILMNYWIPQGIFEEGTITYSFLVKIDGKMKDFTQTRPLEVFNPARFTFDTSGYTE
jgi:hypothetical protein